MGEAKICWILCSNRWNSAITEYALHSAKALQLQGWTCYYTGLAASPGEARARSYALPGKSLSHFGISQVLELRREAKRMRPDLILLFGGPETFLAHFLPSIPKLRFFGRDDDLRKMTWVWPSRLNLLSCKGILTPARIVQRNFQTKFNKPVGAIHLGIDGKIFQWHDSVQAANRPTLRIIGRLDPIKGHAAFFKTYQSLLQVWPVDRPRPYLEIIGQPANTSATELRVAALEAGLKEGESWQLLTSRVSDLSQRMNATHLGIICSLGSEVIGRVAEEFLLSGCPIGVSGVGSLEECLIDASFGVSYRGMDQAAQAQLLADRLWQSYQESPAARKERARAAALYFSFEAMGQQLDQFIAQVRS